MPGERTSTNELTVRYGYADAAGEIQDLYLSGEKEKAAAAVPDELIRRVSLIGSEEMVRDRVAAFCDVGVTTLSVQSRDVEHEDQLATVEKLADIVASV